MPRKDQERKLRRGLRKLNSRAGKNNVKDVLRYASGRVGRGVRNDLRRRFGRFVGDLLAELSDIFAGGGRVTEGDVQDAIQLLEGEGYRVTPAPPGNHEPGAPPVVRPNTPDTWHRDRGPDSQRQPAPPPHGMQEGRPLPSIRDLVQIDDFPAEHTIDTRKLSAVMDPGAGIWATEVETPESSNVYSFAYDEVEHILYVTYKARGKVDPTTKKRPHVRGPLYSYGGRMRPVPAHVYSEMKTASSKGEFVWTHLRMRGTIHGHHYQYSLVTGDTSGGEYYVPRKATRRGFRTRSAVAVAPIRPQRSVGTRRRHVDRSTLPERLR